MSAQGWRGKRVSDMAGAEIRDMTGAAAGVVKIRLSGDPADLNALAAALASAGLEVLDHSGPRTNRHDPGVRVYLTVRISAEGGRR